MPSPSRPVRLSIDQRCPADNHRNGTHPRRPPQMIRTNLCSTPNPLNRCETACCHPDRLRIAANWPPRFSWPAVLPWAFWDASTTDTRTTFSVFVECVCVYRVFAYVGTRLSLRLSLTYSFTCWAVDDDRRRRQCWRRRVTEYYKLPNE